MANKLVGSPKTKKQHFIPQFFLKGFTAGNDNLYYAQRLSGKPLVVRKSTPKGICFEKCLYEVKDSEGESLFPNAIEDIFSKMEDELKKTLDDTVKDIYNLSRDSKSSSSQTPAIIVDNLAFMLAFLFCRHPKEIEKTRRDCAIVLTLLKSKGIGTAESLETAFRRDMNCKTEIPASVFNPERVSEFMAMFMDPLPMSVDGGESFLNNKLKRATDYLRSCSAVVMVAPENLSFIGFDLPACIEVNGIYHFLWSVNNRIAVCFRDDEQQISGITTITKSVVDFLNSLGLASQSWSIAFCRDGKLLQKMINLQKRKVDTDAQR